MRCPFCANPESKVVDSRPADEGASIRRRRECLACHKRFTTYEMMESLPLMVVKKDQRREAFDSAKIKLGVAKACEKRPVPMSEIDDLVREVERQAYSSFDQEITSTQLGEMVMERLARLDEVAYVRFASVYRQFRDIETFMDELTRLLSSR